VLAAPEIINLIAANARGGATAARDADL